MKTLYCINNWVNGNACCGFDMNGSNLFMGVKIVEGLQTIWHRAPFNVNMQKLSFTIYRHDDNKNEAFSKTYYINQFTQSRNELREVLQKCGTGQYDNTLIKKTPITYVVNSGDQQLFIVPKGSDESYLPIEYYEVYRDGELLEVGEDEFQYILDGGDVFFTIPIEDLTDDILPSDPYTITIVYWVRK